MSSEEFTPWFPPRVKPVHVGVYPVRFWRNTISYAKWNGQFWLCSYSRNSTAENIRLAERDGSRNSKQNLPWRGFTKEQK